MNNLVRTMRAAALLSLASANSLAAQPVGHGRRIASEEERFDFSHKGALSPTAPLLDTKGMAVTLARFRGHPVLVNLWATWCVPCVNELPALDRTAARLRGHVAMVAVSQDEDGAAKVLPFWQSHHPTSLTVLMDPRNELGKAANMGGLPATILYDSRGAEVWRASGGTDWSSPLALRMIGMAH